MVEKNTTKRKLNIKMLDVIIALLPAIGVAVYSYGYKVLLVVLTSVVFSVLAECMWNLLLKREQTYKDLSAVVTGLFLALILPAQVPLWIPAFGACFATIVVKNFFGGLNQNFMNPAATSKAFIIASWAAVIAKSNVNENIVSKTFTVTEKFMIYPSGNIGEISILALLLGGIYLIIRKRISFFIPASILFSVYIFSFLFSRKGLFMGDGFSGVMVGSVMLVGFFMANDPATSPNKLITKFIYGTAIGLVTVIIRVYGYNPDGSYYALIVMNLFVPLFNAIVTKNQVQEAITS